MSEREEIIVGNPSNDPPEPNEKEERARLVEVLSRGVTTDRLAVPNLPKHLYGEWVRDDPFEIESMRNLGFWDGSDYARNRALHGDGTAGTKVADVVYMVTHRKTKDIIDDIRDKENVARHAPRKGGKQKEEVDYENNVRASSGGDIPTTVAGAVHKATPQTIADAVRTADQQLPQAPT